MCSSSTQITGEPSPVQVADQASLFVGLTGEQSKFTTTHTREYLRKSKGMTTPISGTSQIRRRALANDV
jgi:hypothetical protein